MLSKNNKKEAKMVNRSREETSKDGQGSGRSYEENNKRLLDEPVGASKRRS